MSKIATLLYKNADDIFQIRKIFNINDKSIKDLISLLKTWIQQCREIPQDIAQDDRWLEGLLLLSKFSVERAKQIIETYFLLSQKHPIVFDSVFPSNPDVRIINKCMYIVPLPKLLTEKERVIILKTRDAELLEQNKHRGSFLILSYMFLILHLRLLHDYNSTTVVIMDLLDVPMANILQFWNENTEMIQTMKRFVRVKTIHILHPPKYLSFVMGLISTVSPVMQNRVEVHSDLSTLQNYIAADNLPPELGGSGESLEQLSDDWLMELDNYEEFFQQRRQQIVSGNFKMSINEKNDTGFGCNGTFRNLDID